MSGKSSAQAITSIMRILLVEDDESVVRFIERGLKEELFAVDVARDGEQALDLGLVNAYDVIILDVSLPERDGFSVLEELRKQGRTARVLMLTARRGVNDRVRGLDGGADDYLTKPFAFAELLARVRVLMRRDATASPVERKCGDLLLDLRTHEVRRAGKLITLTAKEYAVLEYLLRRPGQPVSITELSEYAWDMNFDPASNAVGVTIYRLREKLGEPRLLHTLRGVGYVIRECA